MAGKLCPEAYDNAPSHGGSSTSVKPRPRDAKAFCEGRKAFVDGALKATNPHTVPETKESWDTGWENANTAGGNVPASETCCAQ